MKIDETFLIKHVKDLLYEVYTLQGTLDFDKWVEEKTNKLKEYCKLVPVKEGNAEEYYKSECGRFDFGKTQKDGFVNVRQKDLIRFAEEFASQSHKEVTLPSDEEI